MLTSLNAFVSPVTINGGQVLPFTRGRMGLIISAPPTNRITLGFRGLPVLDQGINLYPNTLPLQLHFDEVHEWMEHDLWAISALGTQVISGWEIIAG